MITFVPNPLKSPFWTSSHTVTYEYISSSASSLSFLRREIWTRMRFGTLRMPLDQTALFNFTSTRTSDVFIIFCANVLICVWLIQEVLKRREFRQFLFRVFWGLAPEHNFPSTLSRSRRPKNTNARHAQIRDKRANKYTAFTFRAFRASLASRNRIHFSRFKSVFTQKFTRLKEKQRSKFARRNAQIHSEITPNEHVPLSPRAELSS